MLKKYSWTIVNNRPKQPIWTGDIDCRDCGRDVIIHCSKQSDEAYILDIEAPDFETACREMQGQISDGIFENSAVTEYQN